MFDAWRAIGLATTRSCQPPARHDSFATNSLVEHGRADEGDRVDPIARSRTGVLHHCWVIAIPAISDRLLLGHLVEPKQQSAPVNTRSARRLSLRGSGSLLDALRTPASA
jgi:hypothetical protein